MARSNRPVIPASDDPVDVLPGIGPARAADLVALGIGNVRDFLHYFPSDYLSPARRISVADAVPDEPSVFAGELVSIRLIRRGWGRSIVEGVLDDGTGKMRMSWFRAAYLAKSLKPGMKLVIKGKPTGKPLRMQHPAFETLVPEEGESDFERILPRYRSLGGLPQKTIRKAMAVALQAIPESEPLSDRIRSALDLPGRVDAFHFVHRPESEDEIVRARRRFLFEELFRTQCRFAETHRARMASRSRKRVFNETAVVERLIASLPFTLTRDQGRVLLQIQKDLASGCPMERLVLGDVGSGKTIVAAAALAQVAQQGGQAALLVPTEILARQHARSLAELLEPLGLPVRLLVSDLPAPEKREALEGLADGSIPIVVGTHALIQSAVKFDSLSLCVIDEQHRFGVRQRAALTAKGKNAHFLLLSATPIPRTLALTLHGDLDLSVIRTMPPGRIPVATKHVAGEARKKAYHHMRDRLREGEQAFILFPLVEESEKADWKAAVEAEKKLAKTFLSEFSLGLLHGRLSSREREETLGRFRAGDLDALICTTVVEVGVDLPRATVMIIEDADRFGLSQLHQIRGRVGRSNLASYCYLSTHGSVGGTARERLGVLERENDGFAIAEADLAIRGPGDLLGLDQSGHGPLRLALQEFDPELVEWARKEAWESSQAPSEGGLPLRAG